MTAAEIEFKTLAKLLSAPVKMADSKLKLFRGRFGQGEVTVLMSEIGAPNFTDKLGEHLAANSYDALLVVGLAGALAPKLKTGMAVVYDSCLDGRATEAKLPGSNREKPSTCDEFVSIPCDATFGLKLFAALREQEFPCARGAGVLVKRVIVDAQHKLELHRQTQAAAVDMETWLVWSVTTACQIPYGALRIIMDEATSDLPDFNAGLAADGRVRVWPTLRALAARPRATWRFLCNLWLSWRRLERAAHLVLTQLANR